MAYKQIVAAFTNKHIVSPAAHQTVVAAGANKHDSTRASWNRISHPAGRLHHLFCKALAVGVPHPDLNLMACIILANLIPVRVKSNILPAFAIKRCLPLIAEDTIAIRIAADFIGL